MGKGLHVWFRLIYCMTTVDGWELGFIYLFIYLFIYFLFLVFVGWRPKVDMWNKVVMTQQHLKLVYLLCVLHLLESGKDAFRNEIHLDKVVMIRQHLKLGYLLSVLHSLGSWKDAFHNEIHLSFDYIHKYENECMDKTIALCFKERLKGLCIMKDGSTFMS